MPYGGFDFIKIFDEFKELYPLNICAYIIKWASLETKRL